MDEFQALELAHAAVALAGAAGAGDAEATVSVSKRFSAEARERTITKLEQSTVKSLHLRVFKDGRKGVLSTSDLSPVGLRDAVRATVAHGAFVAADELAALPDAFATEHPELDLFDPQIAVRDEADKLQDALELERLIRSADSRVENSSGSHYDDVIAVTALANSKGFAGSYAATRIGRSTGPVARDGTVKRTAHYGAAARHLSRIEQTASIARTAVARAVALFGARKPPTMRTAVIFERDVAACLLGDLFGAVNAANVATGNSWLIGRLGDRIGSELVTITDDGRMAGRLGSAPYDGEGVATRCTPVFQHGVLRSYLYDTYYARKLGAASTGNASGSGIRPTNFYLEPRPVSLDALIASTRRGVLVLDTIGFATEHASGMYSRGARGFFIEGGELAYPIDEFTIAGTYSEMLANVDGVADDLRFDATIVSPSFRVAEMTVSGN
jgi:PmbA protein